MEAITILSIFLLIIVPIFEIPMSSYTNHTRLKYHLELKIIAQSMIYIMTLMSLYMIAITWLSCLGIFFMFVTLFLTIYMYYVPFHIYRKLRYYFMPFVFVLQISLAVLLLIYS